MDRNDGNNGTAILVVGAVCIILFTCLKYYANKKKDQIEQNIEEKKVELVEKQREAHQDLTQLNNKNSEDLYNNIQTQQNTQESSVISCMPTPQQLCDSDNACSFLQFKLEVCKVAVDMASLPFEVVKPVLIAACTTFVIGEMKKATKIFKPANNNSNPTNNTQNNSNPTNNTQNNSNPTNDTQNNSNPKKQKHKHSALDQTNAEVYLSRYFQSNEGINSKLEKNIISRMKDNKPASQWKFLSEITKMWVPLNYEPAQITKVYMAALNLNKLKSNKEFNIDYRPEELSETDKKIAKLVRDIGQFYVKPGHDFVFGAKFEGTPKTVNTIIDKYGLLDRIKKVNGFNVHNKGFEHKRNFPL